MIKSYNNETNAKANRVEFFNSNGDFHQLGENGTIISTNPKLNGINTNVNKNGRGFYIPTDVPCYELWSELDARMNGNYNDYLTYLNSHHIVGVEKKMIWIPFELVYSIERLVSGKADEFNLGIPLGFAGIAISIGTEYADNLVRISFKTGRNPFSWSRLTPRQQAWRTVNILGKNAKYVKYAKGLGLVGTAVGVGMAVNNIAQGEGKTIDYFDIGVGGASIGATIFLASNPVGWVIGAGATIYFAGRLVYDIYEETND